MATSVYLYWPDKSITAVLNLKNPTKVPMSFRGRFPLSEDIKIDVKSSFGKSGEKLPSFGIVETAKTYMKMGELGGTSSAFFDLFNKTVWTETQPVRISFGITLYTKTSPFADVIKPAMELINLTIITPITTATGKTSYAIPGWSSKMAKTVKGQLPQLENGSKFINIWIPGVIAIAGAIVEQASPTFSKEVTTQGLPLFCKMELTIVTVLPANSEMFNAEYQKEAVKPQNVIRVVGGGY